jgi:hypothetical protein
MDDAIAVTETLYTEGHSPHDSEDERCDFDNVETEAGSIGESFYDHPDIVKYLDEMFSGSKSPNNLGKLHSPDLETYLQGEANDNILNYSPTVPNVNSHVQKHTTPTEKAEDTFHEDQSIVIEI